MTSVRLAGNNFIIKFNIFIFLYFYEKCRVSYVVRTGTRAINYCIIPPPPYGTPGIPSRVQSRRTVLRTVGRSWIPTVLPIALLYRVPGTVLYRTGYLVLYLL